MTAERMARFRHEAARIRREFHATIRGILERIRERRLRELKEKISA